MRQDTTGLECSGAGHAPLPFNLNFHAGTGQYRPQRKLALGRTKLDFEIEKFEADRRKRELELRKIAGNGDEDRKLLGGRLLTGLIPFRKLFKLMHLFVGPALEPRGRFSSYGDVGSRQIGWGHSVGG